MFQSISLKSTINTIICDLNVPQPRQVEDNEFSWTEIVQKCLEGRQPKMIQLPDITMSEPSMDTPPDDIFLEEGRDMSTISQLGEVLPKNGEQKLMLSPGAGGTIIEKVNSFYSPSSLAASPVRSLAASPASSPASSPAPSLAASPVPSLAASPASSPASSPAPSPTASPVRFLAASPASSPASSPALCSARSSGAFSVRSSGASSARSLGASSARSPASSPVASRAPSARSSRTSVRSSVASSARSSGASSARSPAPSPAASRAPSSDPSPKTATGRPRRRLMNTRLETWRGQRPIYQPLENGCWKVIDVTKPTSYTPQRLKRKRTKRNPSKKEEKAKLDLDLDQRPDLTESFQQRSDETKEKMRKIFLNRDNLSWKKLKTGENIEHTSLVRAKESNQVVGYLRFNSKCSKPTQKSGDYLTVYMLLKGSVSFKIGDDPPVVINEFDPVIIPTNSNYSIENLIDSESLLSFCIL